MKINLTTALPAPCEALTTPADQPSAPPGSAPRGAAGPDVLDMSGWEARALFDALDDLPHIPDLREVVLPRLSAMECLRVFAALGRCPSLVSIRCNGTQARLSCATKPLHSYLDVFCVGGAALRELCPADRVSMLESVDDLRLATADEVRLLARFPALSSVQALITGVAENHIRALSEVLGALPRDRGIRLELFLQQTRPIGADALEALSLALPSPAALRLTVYRSGAQKSLPAEWAKIGEKLINPHHAHLQAACGVPTTIHVASRNF